MKTLLQFAIVLMVATSLFSCKKVSNINSTPTTEAFTTGSWSISYFKDNGLITTSDYNKYIITFFSNGSSTANKTGTITTGSWQIDDDNSTNKVSFNFSG